MDRKCLMEFSTVEDIEEMTVTLAHCSMKSNTKWKGTELSLSRWNISLLINQSINQAVVVVQDVNYNAEESEVYHPNW